MSTLIILLVTLLLSLMILIGALFLIKQSEKNKVKALVFYPDRKMKVYKVNPLNKTITFENKTYNINDKDFIISKGMITYIFNYENTEPLNPYTGQVTEYNPEDYNSAMNSKIIEEIVASSSKQNKFEMSTLNLLIALATIGAVGIIGYLGYNMLTGIQEKINLIIEALKSIGIGGLE